MRVAIVRDGNMMAGRQVRALLYSTLTLTPTLTLTTGGRCASYSPPSASHRYHNPHHLTGLPHPATISPSHRLALLYLPQGARAAPADAEPAHPRRWRRAARARPAEVRRLGTGVRLLMSSISSYRESVLPRQSSRVCMTVAHFPATLTRCVTPLPPQTWGGVPCNPCRATSHGRGLPP